MDENIFPTFFARSIGEQCGLMIKHGPGINRTKYYERIEMMENFQQMAISCSFKDSLSAFHGIKLKKGKKKNLRKIYKLTRPFILSYANSVIVEKLKSSSISGKDAKDITTALHENLGPENKNTGQVKGRFKVNLYKHG